MIPVIGYEFEVRFLAPVQEALMNVPVEMEDEIQCIRAKPRHRYHICDPCSEAAEAPQQATDIYDLRGNAHREVIALAFH